MTIFFKTTKTYKKNLKIKMLLTSDGLIYLYRLR